MDGTREAAAATGPSLALDREHQDEPDQAWSPRKMTTTSVCPAHLAVEALQRAVPQLWADAQAGDSSKASAPRPRAAEHLRVLGQCRSTRAAGSRTFQLTVSRRPVP